MTSKDLLNKLGFFWSFLENIRTNLPEPTRSNYTSVVVQSYDFIQLELKDETQQLFLQVKYQIQSKNKLTLCNFYCDDKSIAPPIKAKAMLLLGDFEWETKSGEKFNLNPEQVEYLEIANRISALSNDMQAFPSSYVRIIITAESLTLEQNNHWNAKSRNHIDSYFLRNLHFVVPLNDDLKDQQRRKIDSYYIGEMEVFFQDRSAKANRAAGDKIMKQLKKEIERYSQ
ncbi:MAG: hypothetical protein RH948_12535 [Cyclobacteriaceae bacterium]